MRTFHRYCSIHDVQAISSLLPILLAAVIAACVAAAPSTKPATPPHITLDKSAGVYDVGDDVVWTINLPDPSTAAEWHYSIRQNNSKSLQQGSLKTGEAKQTFHAKLNEPGWLLLEVTAKNPDGTPNLQAMGAIIAPEKLHVAVGKPDDFDSFWHDQLAALAQVPPNASLAPEDADEPGVEYSQVTLDNVDHAHVHAQIARPTKGDKFPAMLIYQYAGVYPLQKGWVTSRAAKGWLAMNVLAHDLPIDKDKDFYTAQSDGPLKSYTAIGNASKETSYFRHMLLGDYQAIEYLTHRPDWNGQVLLVRGESQGGFQSIAMASLHPKVTAMIVGVPAGCDTLSDQLGQAAGWPYWQRMGSPNALPAIMLTSRYYDPANFAPALKCPALFGVGLCDTTAPCPNVRATFNELTGTHEIVMMPGASHQKFHDAFNHRSEEWIDQLAKTGQPPEEKASK